MSAEEHRKLSVKGGQAKSDYKLWARRARELEKTGKMKPEWAREIKLAMHDSKCSALTLLRVAGEMMEKSPKTGAMIWAQAHKFLHGEKLKTENVHHVIDWTNKLDSLEIKEEDGTGPKEASE